MADFEWLIMTTLPMSVFGAAVGMFVTGYPFGVTAFIGIVGLMGVVVRNGIILRSETNYDVSKYSDLYGNSATPHWHPRGCKKGQTFHRRLYGPHRLKGPLVRKGWKAWADAGFPLLDAENKSKYKFDSRGTDELMPIGWEDAYDYIARGMLAIATRYSGDDGKALLLSQGYPPEMVEATGGAGTRTFKCPRAGAG